MLSKGQGGMEEMGFQYGKTLQEKYFCMSIFHPSSKYAKTNQKDIKYINTLRTINQYDIIAAFKLSIVISANKITHCILHGRRAKKIALLATKFIKNPPKLIFIDHNNFGIKNFENMDSILAISDDNCRLLKQHSQLASKVYKIPNFIDLSQFHNLNKIYTKNKPITVGWMARFHPVKGLDVFFESLKILQNSGLNFKVLIAGGVEKDLTFKIPDSIDRSKIEFCGWVDVKDFYKKIDIFVSSSIDEPFGLTTLYALAYGILTASTPTKGAFEMLDKSTLDLIAEDFTSKSLADKILDICDYDENKIINTSKTLHEIAINNYSKDVFLGDFDEIIRRL